MGTIMYMSAGRSVGRELDSRADLFSFGAVLYELATGSLPFRGEPSAAVFDSILHGATAFAPGFNHELPAGLELIIDKALEKDRNLRYQHASEIRADLLRLKRQTQTVRAAVAGSTAATQPGLASTSVASAWRPSAPVGVAEVSKPGRKKPWKIALSAALVIATLLVATVVVRLLIHRPLAERELKQQQLTANSRENAVANGTISPDGKYLVYWDVKGIHLQLIATGEMRTIPQPQMLEGSGAEWSIGPWFPDGTRFLANASTEQHTSIWVVSGFAGAPRKIRHEATVWSVSPDGSKVVFTTNTGSLGDREVWLMGPNGEQPEQLLAGNDGSAFAAEKR